MLTGADGVRTPMEQAQTCLPGNLFGPLENAATCMAWDTRESQCPTSCESATTCSECASQMACGWCQATSICVPGSAEGPLQGGYAKEEWATNSCAQFDVDCSSATPLGHCSDSQLAVCDTHCIAMLANAHSAKDCPVPDMLSQCDVNCPNSLGEIPSCLDSEMSARRSTPPAATGACHAAATSTDAASDCNAATASGTATRDVSTVEWCSVGECRRQVGTDPCRFLLHRCKENVCKPAWRSHWRARNVDRGMPTDST